MRYVLLALLVCGCAAPVPTSEPVAPPPAPIHDVHWLALCRDYPTASSYTGRSVRLRFAKGEYASEGTELRAWANDRAVPPVLFVRLTVPLPAELAGGPLVVVGTCRGPVRDGIRRAPQADYVVHVEAATVTGG